MRDASLGLVAGLHDGLMKGASRVLIETITLVVHDEIKDSYFRFLGPESAEPERK